MPYYFLFRLILPIILIFIIPFPVVLYLHWNSWKNDSHSNYKIYPIREGIVPALVVFFVLLPVGGIIVEAKWNSFNTASTYIAFSGQAISSSTNEWPNNRLVLLYLKGNEISRNITSAKEVMGNDLGIADGNFYLEAENQYQISQYLLYSDNIPYKFEASGRSNFLFSKSSIIYHWLGQIDEGSTIHIPIPSKNLEYVIKVLQGDINFLPSEILQSGSTRLRDDGQIIVALPGYDMSGTGVQTDGIFVQDVNLASKTENIETNKLTIPINNCSGSMEVSQKYIQSQTFVHQYTGEIGFNIGVEIPLLFWMKILPAVQAKYGFENGQIDTRTVEYNMAAAPGTNVMYIVTWSEVWESGGANISNGTDTIVVPFRVKTNLIYGIASEPRNCP